MVSANQCGASADQLSACEVRVLQPFHILSPVCHECLCVCALVGSYGGRRREGAWLIWERVLPSHVKKYHLSRVGGWLCEDLALDSSVRHACMGTVAIETQSVWREGENGRAPVNPHYIESGCSGLAIPKSGGDQWNHNAIMYACEARLKFSVWIIHWRVCVCVRARARVYLPACE